MADKIKNDKEIMSALEIGGHYVLADAVRCVLADKSSRRKSKVEAIKLAANIRDNLEAIANKLLQKKVGSGVKDVAELLEADFDRLEDKISKILTEYLEYKTNQKVSEEQVSESNNEENTIPPEFEKKPKPKKKIFNEPKIMKKQNIDMEV